jgi:hypothetical protein
MKNNNDDIWKVPPPGVSKTLSDEDWNEVFFEDLVNLIIKFYNLENPPTKDYLSALADDSDGWWKTNLPKVPTRTIPEEVEELVKQNFLKRLRKQLKK